MTDLQLLENLLTELNKVDAPALLTSDYNYWINKGIYHYVNKMYNVYDANQLMTDAIGFLRETKIFSKDEYNNYFILPGDYMHLLSCSVIYDDKASCGSSSSSYGARRMTSDYKGQIFNNYYLKPTKLRPYYMVTNNRLEIFNNNKDFDKVSIDYLKKPLTIEITDENIDTGISNELEFPDYVCFEVINEIIKLILENSSDPRAASLMLVSQSIAPPIPSMAQTS